MRFCLLLSAVLSLACATPAATSPTKPIIEIEAHEAAPQSIDDLWRGSTAVVRGRVVSTSVSNAGGSGVFTVARVRVLDVYKGRIDAKTDSLLTVYQIAGAIEEADRILQIRDAEAVHRGTEYLIFLGWNPDFERWMVRGTSGVFEVLRSGRLRAYGQSPAAKERDGKLFNNMADELRRLRKREAAAQ